MRRHRRERRHDRDPAEGDADADEGGEQRHPGGEQRPERDDEHDAREHHAEHLGDREPEAGVLEDLAAERDAEPGVFADLAGGDDRVVRLDGDLGRRPVELHLDVGGTTVVGDLLAREFVERPEHAHDAVDVFEFGLHVGDRVTVRRLVDG